MSKEKAISSEEMQMVTFELGDENYGIDILNVQEVIRMPIISKVPQTPSYVEGIIKLRGHVAPVINIRSKLGLPSKEANNTNRIIIVDVAGKKSGLRVDSVSEVLRVERRNMETVTTSQSKETNNNVVEGVVKTNQGKKLVMVLDVNRLCDIETQNTFDEEIPNIQDIQKDINSETNHDEVQIVAFLVGEEQFGLDIRQVKMIIRYPDIIKVPNVPDYVKGIVSLGGLLTPIYDLRTKLGIGSEDITESTRVIIADMNGTMLGLTVDRVYEVIRLQNENIFPTPMAIAYNQTNEKIIGIACLEGGKRVIMLMDVEHIINGDFIEGILDSHKDFDGLYDCNPQEEAEEQIVVFCLGEEHFGVSIFDVEEITKLSKITKVPRSPNYVEGVIHLRKEVVPIIDLRKRFDLEWKEFNQSTRVITISIDQKKIGFIVDEVLEVLRLSEHCIEDAPTILVDNKVQNLVQSIANLKEHTIMILDTKNILQTTELKRIAGLGQPKAKENGMKLKKQSKN